jgi:hypothetical protein
MPAAYMWKANLIVLGKIVDIIPITWQNEFFKNPAGELIQPVHFKSKAEADLYNSGKAPFYAAIAWNAGGIGEQAKLDGYFAVRKLIGCGLPVDYSPSGNDIDAKVLEMRVAAIDFKPLPEIEAT